MIFHFVKGSLNQFFLSVNSFLMASFRSHTQTKELIESGNRSQGGSEQFIPQYDVEISTQFPQKESNSSSLDSAKSYSDTQLEIFNHRHGLLVLHLLATLMFVPSLIAWIQVFLFFH